MANDDHTIALVKAHAVGGEMTPHRDSAEIFHGRAGKCVERWAFSEETARIVEPFA